MLSYHDFEKTPFLDDLSAIISKAATRGLVVKISTFVAAPSEIKRLQQLLLTDWGVPRCVIGMGTLGTSTRIGFPAAGSCLTYGYLDVPTAPGQLPARTLVKELRKLLPVFDEDLITRNPAVRLQTPVG